jgi:hypothetical protein
MQHFATRDGMLGISFETTSDKDIAAGFVEKVGWNEPMVGESYPESKITVDGVVYSVINVTVYKPIALIWKFDDRWALLNHNPRRAKLVTCVPTKSVLYEVAKQLPPGFYGYQVPGTGAWMRVDFTGEQKENTWVKRVVKRVRGM